MKFIIEHLENRLYEWCLIEYKNISRIVGKNNLIFTNIKNPQDVSKLINLGGVKIDSVTKLRLENACLLDPKAKKTLKQNEKFDYFIFGGILGDFPEQGRTEKYLTSRIKNVEVRNLGKKQMSTDTAVLVTKMTVEGTRLEKIRFIDNPNIPIKKGKIQEEINLPYRYLLKNNKPLISNKLIKYLKEKDGV